MPKEFDCELITWAVVTGLSKKKKTTRPQPAQHLLYKGPELFIIQVHQQPIGEDEVKAKENIEWIHENAGYTL